MLYSNKIRLFIISIMMVVSCSATQDSSESTDSESTDSGSTSESAAVTAVSVTGDPGNFTFRVEVSSPDTGCEKYADWWEVVSEDGELLYRRVLLHSHVNEQPFTRSGGPVDIDNDTDVWVRAHMNNTGYGDSAMFGSVNSGFSKKDTPENFGSSLSEEEPLPDGCAF